MISTTKFSFKFDWLLDSADESRVINQDASGLFPMPLPKEIGSGWFENITLALGMSLFHGVAQFVPGGSGKLVELANVSVDFEEPTFQVQSVAKGRVIHRELTMKKELVITPGRELFRLSEGFQATPVLDSSLDIAMMSLTISRSMLVALLGEQVASDLLAKFGLIPWPCAVVAPVPMAVSAPLHQCVRANFSPDLRLIHAQARSMDFLSGLAVHVLGPGTTGSRRADRRRRAQEVHDYLVDVEGRFPTLIELSRVFGRSARTLNDEFLTEFGDTIFGFMSNRRLTMAHDVIANSDVALKIVADTLGYTHVNNFSAAFRRKFGYAPGAVRRTRTAVDEAA